MKYTVTINEKSKSITVDLDGYKGTAKCCPTDSFNITTGIELALERAKVAKANAEKPTEKPMGVMELVKALEKALPKGQVVVVGNCEGLTARHKEWLHSMTDCKGGCSCEGECYTDEEIEDIKADAYDEGYEDGKNDADDRYDEGYDDGHADGYDAGYADALDEVEENSLTEDEVDELTDTIRGLIEDALGV
jgi:flagellar biosynthesis/type III secretory pathway protein FliH